MTPQQQADLRLAGFQAYRTGTWAGDCPHPFGTLERHFWLEGFRDGIDAAALRSSAVPADVGASQSAAADATAEEESWLARLADLLRPTLLVPIDGGTA